MSEPNAEPKPAAKVFISYSWSTEEHKQWVKNIADRLIMVGVDVVGDFYDLPPGHDKFAFMERMVNDPTVERVLLVCDRQYAEKANSRKGGVGTETEIVTPEVYNHTRQEKFIPVLRERHPDGTEALPTYLKTRIYFDLTDGQRYGEELERLERFLLKLPEFKRPPLGEPPAHYLTETRVVSETTNQFQRLKDAVERGKGNVGVIRHDYLQALSEALAGFRITDNMRQQEREGRGAAQQVIDAVEQMRLYRDEFIDFAILYASYQHNDPEAFADVHGFLERLLPLFSSQGSASYYDCQFDAHKHVGRELVLYLLAALMGKRRHKLAAEFMDARYYHQREDGRESYTDDITAFDQYTGTLEREQREDRQKSRAQLTLDAAHPRIPVKQIVHADLLVCLRRAMRDQDGWYPRLTPLAHNFGPIEVLARARTPTGLPAVQELFDVRDLRGLAEGLFVAMAKGHLKVLQSERSLRFGNGIEELLNWKELRGFLTPGPRTDPFTGQAIG